ncbi:TolC family protein [bacterium]|nr:TolC family protein [bacterium]
MKLIIRVSLVLVVTFSLGAITLQEAISRGLEANSQVLTAGYKRDSAKEDAKIAFTGLLPHASADGSYTRLDEVPVMTMPLEFGGMSIEMGKQNNYNLTLGVQQPIFTGGKIINGYRAARNGAKIQQENLRNQKSSTAVSISEAYYGVVKADLFGNTMQQARKRMNGHLKVIEGMFTQGLISRNNLLQTRVASSEIDLMIIQSRNAVKASRLVLNFLLDFPADTTLELDPDTAQIEVSWASLEWGLDYGLKYRPDIKMLEYGLDAAKAGKLIALGAFSPDVVGVFNWSYKRPNQALEEEFYDSWNVTLAASWSLISFGERIFGVRKANSQRREAEETLDMVHRAAEMEIRIFYNNLEEKTQSLDVSRIKLEQANEGYRVAEAEFSTGMAVNTDVLDANSTLIQAQAEYISAVVNLKLAVVQYEAAISSLLKE